LEKEYQCAKALESGGQGKNTKCKKRCAPYCNRIPQLSNYLPIRAGLVLLAGRRLEMEAIRVVSIICAPYVGSTDYIKHP
jgi:hypothetical protein